MHFWADDERREVYGHEVSTEFSVAQVGRLYAMNKNLTHKWMKKLRFVPVASAADEALERFLFPVESAEGSPVLETFVDHIG